MSIDVLNEPSLRADACGNRDSILKTAMQQFGVGAGTLYRHFPSCETLIAAVLRDRQAELLAASRDALDIPDADAALTRWLEASQDYLRTFNGLPAPILAAVKERAMRSNCIGSSTPPRMEASHLPARTEDS